MPHRTHRQHRPVHHQQQNHRPQLPAFVAAVLLTIFIVKVRSHVQGKQAKRETYNRPHSHPRHKPGRSRHHHSDDFDDSSSSSGSSDNDSNSDGDSESDLDDDEDSPREVYEPDFYSHQRRGRTGGTSPSRRGERRFRDEVVYGGGGGDYGYGQQRPRPPNGRGGGGAGGWEEGSEAPPPRYEDHFFDRRV